MLYQVCMICGAIPQSPSASACTQCGFGQKLALSASRIGECQCQGGSANLLICTVTGFADGKARSYCIDCATLKLKVALASYIIGQNSQAYHGPQSVTEAIAELAKGKLRRYTKEAADRAVVTAVGNHQSRRERSTNRRFID